MRFRTSYGLRVLCTLAALALASPVGAQRLHVSRYSTSDGLPGQDATAVLQDVSGRIWVATSSGLASYDGSTFRAYTEADGLADNRVTAIAESADGTLVVATRNGVSWRRPNESRDFLGPGPTQAPFWARDLARYGGGVVVATPDGVVQLRFDAGPARLDTLHRVDALTVFGASDGTLWVGGNGFVRRANKGVLGAPVRGIHATTQVHDILEDDAGRIWLATSAGLFRAVAQGFEPFAHPALEGERARVVLAGSRSPDGTMWFATWGGVIHVAGESAEFFTEANGLPHPNASGIAVDREGNVWIATPDGVGKLVPGSFVAYTAEHGLPDNAALDIVGDDEGNVWVATARGVAKFESGMQFVRTPLSSLLRREQTRAFAIDAQGRALVGTANGLLVNSGEGMRWLRRGDGLPSSRVTELQRGPDGEVWVGMEPGLVRWRDGSVDLPGALSALRATTVRTLGVDTERRLWVGTDAGLLAYDLDADRLLDVPDELRDLDVLSIAADGEQGVWFGTDGYGAYRLHEGAVRQYSTRQGLVSNFVRQVWVDRADRVWMFTNRGLERLESDGALTHFGAADGLIALEGLDGAVWEDAAGRLWFGTRRGVIRFDPQRSERPIAAPLAAIVAISAGGIDVPTNLETRLGPASNNPTFRFAALSYVNERGNRFLYRLTGLTDEWSETSEPEITYAGLGPGAYVFEVHAVNAHGQRAEVPATFAFEILPALHQTWWFRVLVVAIALLTIYALHRLRTAYLARERRTLERLVEARSQELAEQILTTERVSAQVQAKSEFFAQTSHEIRTPINGVLGMADLLMFTPLNPRQRHLARTLRRSGETLLELLNDILDMSKIEAGKLRLENTEFDLFATVSDVVALLAERARAKSVQLHCRIDPFVPAELMGDAVRLRQVLLNLIDNAIKFTDHGSVSVGVDAYDDRDGRVQLRFTVVDTGIGISEEAQRHIFEAFEQADDSTTRTHGGTGLGLNICRQLVQAMGGRLEVDSAPGEGTTMRFTARFGMQPRVAAGDQIAGVRVLAVGVGDRLFGWISRQLEGWQAEAIRADDASFGIRDSGALALSLAPAQVLLVETIDGDVQQQGWLRRVHEVRPDLPVVMMVAPGATAAHPDDIAGPGWQLVNNPPGARGLLSALLRAVAPPGVESNAADGGSAVPAFTGRVLLADDNPVNQEIAVGMLEHVGCTVHVVGNGAEAAAAAAAESFDLILMDCEMPEMDGLEATRTIRGAERAAGAASTPIVAMTASVGAAFRDVCIEAGMNAYLSKPHTLQELCEVLATWLGQRDPVAQLPAMPAAESETPAAVSIDLNQLNQIRALQRPGESDLLERIVRSFVDDSARLRAELERAVQTGQAEAVRTVSHGLVSASGNMGAPVLMGLARQLERMGRSGDLENAACVLRELDAELAVVVEFLNNELREVVNG